MAKYTTNGVTVTNGNGFMGIYSTVSLLNDKVKKVEELTKLLESVNDHAESCQFIPERDCNCYYDRIVKALASGEDNG